MIRAIEKEIPESKKSDYEEIKAKRVERQMTYKNKLRQEILDLNKNDGNQNEGFI